MQLPSFPAVTLGGERSSHLDPTEHRIVQPQVDLVKMASKRTVYTTWFLVASVVCTVVMLWKAFIKPSSAGPDKSMGFGPAQTSQMLTHDSLTKVHWEHSHTPSSSIWSVKGTNTQRVYNGPYTGLQDNVCTAEQGTCATQAGSHQERIKEPSTNSL
jgi:hypothetical protein